MTLKNIQLKLFTFPILLIILPNSLFFIWSQSIDTITSYQHLTIITILLSSGMVVANLYSVLRQQQLSSWHKTDSWVFLFTLLVVLNIKFSFNNLVTDEHLLTYFLSINTYIILRLFCEKLTNQQKLFIIFSILAFIEIGFLLIELVKSFYLDGLRLTVLRGSFDNSGKLGIYLSMLYPCLLHVLLLKTTKAGLYKSILFVLFILVLIFLILSLSRIAWVSVFVSSAIIFTWHLESKRKKIIFYLAIGISAIILACVIFLFKQDSASGRVLIWNITANHLTDHWYKGVGYGKFSSIYNLWQSDYFSTHEVMDKKFYVADNTYFAFNEFLQTAIELGWLGGILWLLLLIYILKQSFKKNLWAVACTGFLITCLASYPFRELQHQMLFFTFLALFANKCSQRGQQNTSSLNRLQRAGGIILTAFSVVYLTIAAVFYFSQSRAIPDWKEARAEFPFDERRGLNLYRKANIRLYNNPEFLLEYGVRMVEADSFYTASQILNKSKRSFVSQIHLIELGYCYERLKDYQSSKKYYLQGINVSPSKLAPRYQLLLFYDKIGEIGKAKHVATVMQSIAPKLISDDRAKMIKELTTKYLEKVGSVNN